MENIKPKIISISLMQYQVALIFMITLSKKNNFYTDVPNCWSLDKILQFLRYLEIIHLVVQLLFWEEHELFFTMKNIEIYSDTYITEKLCFLCEYFLMWLYFNSFIQALIGFKYFYIYIRSSLHKLLKLNDCKYLSKNHFA